MNRAPHPNAAKVAINWFLSREGQSTWLEHVDKMGSVQNPVREDFPRGKGSGRREPGAKYFQTLKYEYLINTQPVMDLLKKSLEESKKQ
jgi:ABC-type Fe3+ transport system substrate-binding protein